jgi:prepilin-type N-terminal cleavage/methylation domain-containing protein
MKWCSDNINISCGMRSLKCYNKKAAFSLVEVVTALAILALISSSVFVVIDRCVTLATDSTLHIQAFEVARENMEKLLASSSIEEGVEYGQSDKHPGIVWQTIVETFYEPITARMWIRGVCVAEYEDTQGQEQKVELTHWLTDLTRGQLLEIMNREEQEELLSAQLIGTIEEAAAYAGVDVQTIEQWLENGMLRTGDGAFIKMNLDIYKNSNGSPSSAQKSSQAGSEAELVRLLSEQKRTGEEGEIDPQTGLPYEELDSMDTSEIYEFMKSQR